MGKADGAAGPRDRTIKAVLSYDGSGYLGWQRQKNGSTVQAVFEDAVREWARPVKVVAASRTDAGAHARGQVVHFRVATDLSDRKLKTALNARLPGDVAVESLRTVKDNFHARFDARAKLYRYTIHRGRVKPVFDAPYVYWVRRRLDIFRMRKAARCLVGRHDFTAFSARDGGEKSRIRLIQWLRLRQNAHRLWIDIKGDGFLRNMIRIIVGTLIDVGRGKKSVAEFERILGNKDRTQAGPTAKAMGLSLMRVYY